MTDAVFLHDMIRPDVKIHHPETGQLFDADYLDNLECFLMGKIYHCLDGQTVDKTCVIWSNDLPLIIPTLRAAWKLGMAIAVHDINVGYTDHPAFRDFYRFLDLVVVENEITNGFFPDKKKVGIKQFDPGVQYPAVDYVLDRPIDASTVAVRTHSSGTTGFPKILDITHSTAREIVKHVAELFQFDESDRPLHLKTLHHGSLFLNYAMPLLSVCQDHYWIAPAQNVSKSVITHQCLQLCSEKKLTAWLVPMGLVDRIVDCAAVHCPDLTLISIKGVSRDSLEVLLKQFGIKQFCNLWGCTELGAMFLSKTNLENLADYNPNRFDIKNPYVDYEIQADFVRARHRDSDLWHIIADRFLEVDDGARLWWLGRTAHLVVDGRTVDINVLAQTLTDLYQTTNFVIVPDFEMNRLYLAMFDDRISSDIAQVNHRVTQVLGSSYQIDMITRVQEAVMDFGMKPPQPLLLYMFRNLQQATEASA
jgi:hypothetical protein